ncbi:uncharacterized protein LOC8283811 [Ricinus communis]|uniref:uncharacterized protein LOC8283811 n=1 Tax=Ricinus communis TaxID=3988 RepID=UPI00201AF154|nr:uncharacterized protein LOC8283811 [Ricinus communis]
MKLSTKPISSPGRAEKYPPPLMRFLRSNVGSRSRGRSRSSPMFVRKKNAAIETQEPTSPKVTCMGQVRVKRSKQPKNRTGTGKNKSRCKWIKNALFCRHFSKKLLKPKCSRPSLRKWVLFFHVGFRRKSKTREDCEKIEPKFSNTSQDLDQESVEVEEDEEEKNEAKVYVSTAITPPRNALLLTRSRSAPYRSSSLASRFWGSPLSSKETEKKERTEQHSTEEEEEDEEDEDDSTTSKRELLCKEPDQESRLHQETEEKTSFSKDFEGPITSVRERISRIEEFKREEDGTVHPLILTRCKSEPARIAEKLDPEISFWKKRRDTISYTSSGPHWFHKLLSSSPSFISH